MSDDQVQSREMDRLRPMGLAEIAAEIIELREANERTKRAQQLVFGKRELITDMERQLVVLLITKEWVAIKDDIELRREAAELEAILRKITGVDKRIEVSS